jgi:DNA-binding transcriptional ArsR family regulator
MNDKRSVRYLLGWLIVGTRGGLTRAKIIRSLRENPYNAHQLATTLEMDYSTIRHHLDVLYKNKLIVMVGEEYGRTYFLSTVLEENYELFESLSKRFGKKEKRKKKK